jgi:O-antigen ligase
VTRDFQPRASYAALAAFSSNPPPVRRPAAAPVFSLVLLGVVAAASAWRGARYAPLTEIAGWWRAIEKNWLALPEWAQFTLLALVVGAFYLSPNVLLNFVLLALCVPLFALRLDLALVLLVWAIPFWLYPKTLFGNFEMSLVEVLTLASAAAWIWRWLLTYPLRFPPVAVRQLSRPGYSLRDRLGQLLGLFSSLDWAVLALVLLGLLSTQVAANFGVAMREFRVIVIEPALLYALVRVLPFTHGTDERIGIRESSALIERLINALLLSGLVVCLIGLAQFARGDLIVGAGVQRVRAVWGSPNNAALFLGRLLPVALAFAMFWTNTRRRWLYLGMAGLLAATILLTYSLGALVLGLPASLGFIALWWLWSSQGHLRRQRAVILGLLLLGLLAVVVVVGSTRFQTLFVTGTGTGFFRLAVWTSGVNIIRDHPLFGVGLDNFLYEYPKYILPEAWREPNLSHPHNVLLDFWVRLGLLGAVVLVWLQVAFFRRAWHLARTTTDAFTRACVIGLMASMIDFLAHGMIDAAYFVVDLAFVFMLTLGIMANLAASQK